VITANWPEIIGTLLLIAGGILTAIVYVPAAMKAKPAKPDTPNTRSADAGPPPGAVEWVLDIQTAMGASHASNVLEALADGCCRDQARARRIEQLEAHKPVAMATAAFVSVDPGASAAFEQAMSNAERGIKAEVTP
jgi:hypothetical protein